MSEKDEIKRDGAIAQKNSGRGKFQKADATLGEICYDIKEYTESFSVSRKVWKKISTDALTSGKKIPALKLVLGSKENERKVRLWVIDDSMFKEMLEAWNERFYLET